MSESSEHSRIGALTCIDFVIREVEKHITLTKVILWSDGCAAQFRSRFVFKLISTYHLDLQISWHYNEAHHGKGPMDGIGGTLKNVVFRQVMSGKIIINSAEEFCKAANQFCPSITTLFQKANIIPSEPDDIEKAPIIPATLKIHMLKRSVTPTIVETIIKLYFLSNGKEPCCVQKYATRKKYGHADHEFDSLENLEVHAPTVWKNTVTMKSKTGRVVQYACNGFINLASNNNF